MTKTVIVNPITRLEGHVKLNLQFTDSRTLEKVEFQSYEPPRGFERLFIGMAAEQVPRLAGRICGICYSAHGVAAVQAIENAWGVKPPEDAVKLREVMLLANLLQSHTLHFVMLALPDLVTDGSEKKESRNVLGLMKTDRELVGTSVRLRAIGQEMTEILGARQIHPATIVPGGFTKSLSKEEIDRIAVILHEAENLVKILKNRAEIMMTEKATLMREFGKIQSQFLCLKQNNHLTLCNADVERLSRDGQVLTMDAKRFSELIEESVVDYSFTKRPFLKGLGLENEPIRVGPLARVNRCSWNNELVERFEGIFSRPTQSTLAYNIARVIEIDECLKRMGEIINGGIGRSFRVVAKPREGTGVGIVEAPRGLLFHYYSTDKEGITREANVITPTALNAYAIEKSAEAAARQHLAKKTCEEITREDLNRIEMAVRAYDPCVSCAVHVTMIERGR